MKKWLKYALLTVVLLILLGGVALMVCLDSVIKGATQTGLAFATQTEVKLDKASLNPLSGNLKLTGMDIKNPKGFEADSSFVKFAASEVQVRPKSLLSDKIEVDTVNLDGLELSYIQPSEGKANYEVILDSVNRLLPQGDPSKPEPPKEKSPSNKAIHVGLIQFTHATVHASVAVLGKPVKLDVPLPDFKMENLEVKDGMPALTAEVTKALVAQLIKQAPAIGKKALESAKDNLKSIDVKGATDAVKGIGDLFKKK